MTRDEQRHFIKSVLFEFRDGVEDLDDAITSILEVATSSDKILRIFSKVPYCCADLLLSQHEEVVTWCWKKSKELFPDEKELNWNEGLREAARQTK